MRRTVLGALLAAAALAAPVAPAQAEPTAAAFVLDIDYACFGCGIATGSFTGTVTAGEGSLRTGATISGEFFSHEPTGATCLMTGTASGSFTTSDGYATSFNWTRVVDTVTMTFGGTTTATGKHYVTSPAGNPCGGPATAFAVFGGGGETGVLPAARGHVTIHRFPAATGSTVGDVRLWAAPVAQNGTPWACRDIHTGAPVVQGSQLTSPDPGVSCEPPPAFSDGCTRVDAGGYHAEAGSGTVTITSTCGAVTVSATAQVPSSWPAFSRSAAGDGSTPWTCQVAESLRDRLETDYWVFCDANL